MRREQYALCSAVTGMWGISFLVAWPSTIINWAGEREFAWKEIRRGLAVYGGILLLVLLFGQLRLMFAPSPQDTVRVAGIVAVDFRAEHDELRQLAIEDWEGYRQMTKSRHVLYFNETVREEGGRKGRGGDTEGASKKRPFIEDCGKRAGRMPGGPC
jgi:hypothetical protein